MSIETYVDGDGPPVVVVIPSYRRDGGEDFEPFTAAVVIGSLMGAALAAALVCLQRGDTTEQLKSAVQQAIGIAVTGLHNVRSAVSPDQEQSARDPQELTIPR